MIQKILEAGAQAPSGENCQPWKFRVRAHTIYVFNIPGRDQSPYNFRQRGSYVAHGALLENISIAAAALGYPGHIEVFPDRNDADIVATVVFSESKPKDEPLYQYIIKRATNRKPYKKTPLAQEVCHALLHSAGDIVGGNVLLTGKREDIKVLSLVGSMNERLALENKSIHDFLFSHINWTDEENQQKKLGFDIKTLELPPPARATFRLFRHWPILKVLNRVGASKAVWKQNGKVYDSSAAVGIVAVRGNKNSDFVTAGRIMERVWLTATKLGLSFQPMTGILFFMQRIFAGNFEPFTSRQVELIKESYEKVRQIFKLERETIPIMFRLGYADPPTAQSLKLPPEIIDLQQKT
ncbi:MAG: nitroreductase family protein [Candidatus Liptonbacteria bacterium]|nr:nitroreductase family protein [Candidatus Liptonbacteria bacterium]